MAVVYLCGWECGDTLTKQTVTANVTIATTPVRTGQRSLRVNASGTHYMQHFLNTAQVTSAVRVYVRWTSLPSTAADHPFLINIASAGTQARVTVTNLGVLKFGFTPGSYVTHATTVVTGRWYRFDLLVQNNDGSGTKKMDIQVDGVAGPSQSTLVEAGANTTAWRFGYTGSTTSEVHYDDAIIGNDAGDYPFGEGQVDAVYPNADGTHSFTVGDFGDDLAVVLSSSTVLHQKLAETIMPLSAAALSASFLEQIVTRTTGYLEFLFNTAGITGDPKGICMVAAMQAETAAAATAQVRANDNGTVEAGTTVGTSVSVTTIKHAYKVVALRPSTSTAWTASSMGTLRVRWGYSGDADPDIRLDALIIEIDHPGRVFKAFPYPQILAQ
jgi:hypothetical protein